VHRIHYGCGPGVQATAARWLGAGRTHEVAIPLNGGLLLALLFGLPVSVILYMLAPLLFSLLSQDADVTALGGTYLQVRLISIVATGMNFAFRGYWNAVNLSRMFMRTVMLMHISNIFLNWVLIFGHLGAPALGVSGAAIGTTISIFLGTLMYFFLAWRHARVSGFLSGLPNRATLLSVLRLSAPAGLQQLFFAAGFTAFFWILGTIGTAELAAGNVLLNIMLAWILPANGFGLAAASLIGQTLGAGEKREAKMWAWQVARITMCVVGGLALPALLFPDLFLSVFLHDPNTLALARTPLRLVAALMTIEALGIVLVNSHYGAGHSRRVLAITTPFQWGLFLPAAYLIGVVLNLGALAVWCAYVSYRFLQTCVVVWSWQQGDWAKVEI
jgi:MATE family multidrug resistance protein